MSQYTTTDFLNSVRQRGSLPTTTNTNNVNSTTNLLNLATEELHIKLVPMLLSVREEFYVATKSYSITAAQANYSLPANAVGMIVRDIQIITGSEVKSLSPVDSEFITTTAAGDPIGFYLEHNNIVLYPTPVSTAGTLRVRYFQRPNRLATTAECAQISSINTATSTITVSSIPSTWATGVILDFIGASVPYRTIDNEYTTTSVSSTTIVFSALPLSLAVGDWLAPTGYSPIPQIPFEFQPLLAQMTVVKALESLGDSNGVKQASENLKMIEAAAIQLISPRVQGEAKRVVRRTWWR